MHKKILYILRKPPYQGVLAQETLDVVFTLAAFDQFVNLLFLDDAVFQLKMGQHPAAGLKNIASMLQALPLYDVNQVFVESESLEERGLALSDLALDVIPLTRSGIGNLCQQYDVILAG